jgi:lipopolysaccharide export system ATP-binding protein
MFKRARAGLGYLAQEPSIFRRLSVEDNLNAILEHLPLLPEERNGQTGDAVGDLGLTKLSRQMAYTCRAGKNAGRKSPAPW